MTLIYFLRGHEHVAGREAKSEAGVVQPRAVDMHKVLHSNVLTCGSYLGDFLFSARLRGGKGGNLKTYNYGAPQNLSLSK